MATTSLAGRAELLSGLFVLASLWCYLTRDSVSGGGGGGGSGGSGGGGGKCILAVCLAGMGMLCKETAITVTGPSRFRS